jgi:hypothetical protein
LFSLQEHKIHNDHENVKCKAVRLWPSSRNSSWTGVSGALGKTLAAMTVFFLLDGESRLCIVPVLSYGDIATSNSPRLPSANRHTFETMSRI